ncbi:MAG: NAD-dependent epimerase/dehydratase family protein [Pseudomonadota bacterium]
MTRVLVTGAAGFLGRHLVRLLTEYGNEVTAFDLAFDPPLDSGADIIKGSVTNQGDVARAVMDCDAAIHCAAITGLWAKDPNDFTRVNVEGTQTVLDSAFAAGITRVVHVSSFVTLITGGRGDLETVDERLELPVEAMLGPYPRSKREAELLCRAHPAGPMIVQPTAPIGPGDHSLTPPSRMLSEMANGDLPALIDCTWNFVDIRDLAEGVIAALEIGREGRRYLLGGTNMTTGEFAALFQKVAGRPAPRMRVPHWVALAAAKAEAAIGAIRSGPPKAPLTGVRLAGPRRQFDISRAMAELEYTIRDPEESFRDALTWMAEAGQIDQGPKSNP